MASNFQNFKIERRLEYINTLSPEELRNLIIEQDKEIEKLNGILEKVFHERELNNAKSIQAGDYIKSSEYIQEWDIITKILFIINNSQRPLQSSELLTFLTKYDNNAKYWGHKVGTLSSYLNRAVKYERLISHKVPGKNGHYYFLPEWLDENKELKPDYKIKRN